MEKETLSVVGMGKLGLATAACLAYKGYRVIGVDIKQSIVEAINRGHAPLYEPGLAGLMEKVKGRFTATSDYKYAVDNSSIIFIFVGTPSKADHSFSTIYVEEAARAIAPYLRERKDFPIIVLRSTVLPGVTEQVLKPLLELISGRRCGTDFGLCHNPEILALGSVIHDFLNPDAVIIGESDARAGERLARIYQTVCENDPRIFRTSLANAEMAKVSLNVFLTMKMSFANTMAEICEQIPGGDVDAVSDMLGLDKRIGRKFLTGAIGWGGPCFPRDTKAFFSFAERIGCQGRLAHAADEVNNHQNGRVVSLIKQRIGELSGRRIAILGLTYKPNTDIVLDSDSIKIAAGLLNEGAGLSVYDPAGMTNARIALGEDNIEYTGSVADCLKDAELCVLATPWDEFKKLQTEDFTTNMKEPVLLDCWRALRHLESGNNIKYMAIGLNTQKKKIRIKIDVDDIRAAQSLSRAH